MVGQHQSTSSFIGLHRVYVLFFLVLYLPGLCRDEDAPAQVPDESAVKPDGWLDDEPEYTGDPDAVKPEDWYIYTHDSLNVFFNILKVLIC